MRLRAVALGFALFAAIAAGINACSVSPVATPIVFDEPLPDDPGPDVGGRALQELVFADGEVTFAEYERATVAAIQCMRDEGFQVEGPLRYPDGGLLIVEPGHDPRLRLSLRADVGNDPTDRFGRVNGRCRAQWSYAIEQVYLRQFAPSEEEVRAWLERAWACGRERGLPLSNPPTENEALDAVGQGCRPWETGG